MLVVTGLEAESGRSPSRWVHSQGPLLKGILEMTFIIVAHWLLRETELPAATGTHKLMAVFFTVDGNNSDVHQEMNE